MMAIEQGLMIEELTGRLITAEKGYDHDDTTDGVNKLLLTEEKWVTWQKQRVSYMVGKTLPKPQQQH